jgi:hypothetical protein
MARLCLQTNKNKYTTTGKPNSIVKDSLNLSLCGRKGASNPSLLVVIAV